MVAHGGAVRAGSEQVEIEVAGTGISRPILISRQRLRVTLSLSLPLAALVSWTQQTVIMFIVTTILIYRAERGTKFFWNVAAFPAGGVGAEAGTAMCDRDRWRRDPGMLPTSSQPSHVA